MPNCFTLTKIGESEPTSLVQIDEEICQHFGVKPHPELYYEWWFDTIGFSLAMGRTFDQIIANLGGDEEPKPRLVEIAEFLRERFIPNAWYQHK